MCIRDRAAHLFAQGHVHDQHHGGADEQGQDTGGGEPAQAGAPVSYTHLLKTAEEFGEIVVRSDADSGRIVRLRDVATVELGSSSYAGSSTFNGKESVGLSLYRSPDANALATMNRIKACLLYTSRCV